MYRMLAHRVLGALLSLGLISAAAPAIAGVCFTSGKVYVQQKVWDKAAATLECARKQEPQNLQVYLLLGSARGELNQYASAGAAFTLGIQAAKQKNDAKKAEDLRNNQKFYMSRLYNLGVSAMSLVVPGTEAAAEDASDAPRFKGPSAPETAITDTTVYGPPEGLSNVEKAAHYFRLATLVDPSAVDAYRNLSYVYEVMGRTDDAIAAARAGLALAPSDQKLALNLRAAAVGRANRLYKAGKFAEAIEAYRRAIPDDPASKLLYESQIASSWYQLAQAMDEKAPQRPSTLDSASVSYEELLRDTPAESTLIRETAHYNVIVIRANQGKYKEAVETVDKAVAEFPKSKDLLSLGGQTKFNANDFAGAVVLLKRAVAIDPKDATLHQFLFLSLNKLNKPAESVAEYSMYKALGEGKKREGSDLKKWVDAADNRLGPSHQLKKTLAAEGGYPDEVRTFSEEGKSFESWFYWNKGKMITFMDGQVLSQTTFPPLKS